MRIWLVAAAFAGLAGVVYAYYLQFISPEQFGLAPAIQVLAAVVVGGVVSVYGSVVGVLVLWLLPDLLSGIQNYAILAWGASLIFFMIFAPSGIVGSAIEAVERVLLHREAVSPDETAFGVRDSS
jgi:branched-chain amino acid transport system permease protein